VGRRAQQYVQGDVLQPIPAAAEVFHLLDQVEEREEQDQRQHDDRGRRDDLDREIAPERPHARRRIEKGITRR
jgi:hypothetical protein